MKPESEPPLWCGSGSTKKRTAPDPQYLWYYPFKIAMDGEGFASPSVCAE